MKAIKMLTLFSVLAVTLFACKKSNDGPPPPTVTNSTDNFTFQASNSAATSATYEYAWVNTGQTAAISVTSTVTSGTANVTIFDANGTQVYTNDIQTSGSFVTSTGTPGNWKIRVVLSGANGNVSFTVQKH